MGRKRSPICSRCNDREKAEGRSYCKECMRSYMMGRRDSVKTSGNQKPAIQLLLYKKW